MSQVQKRALISVNDKSGIVEFAHALAEAGYEIVSRGGTHKVLKQGEISVKQVEELTGFPEILEGRVKTLHPKIFGALLARRSDPGHRKDLMTHAIDPIDIVVVNLYPFEQHVTKNVLEEKEILELIDIGGVT